MWQDAHYADGKHLSSDVIERFHEGSLSVEAFFEADAHLFSCADCMARLNKLVEHSNRTDNAVVHLSQAFEFADSNSSLPIVEPPIVDFPSFETIAGYVEGTLSPPEVIQFELALNHLPDLPAHVEDLRRLHQRIVAANIVTISPKLQAKTNKAREVRSLWFPTSRSSYSQREVASPSPSKIQVQAESIRKEYLTSLKDRASLHLRVISAVGCFLIISLTILGLNRHLLKKKEKIRSTNTSKIKDIERSNLIESMETRKRIRDNYYFSFPNFKKFGFDEYAKQKYIYTTQKSNKNRDPILVPVKESLHLSPTGTNIHANNLILHWLPSPGFRQVVTLFDETANLAILKNSLVQSNQYILQSPLAQGHSYSWILEIWFIKDGHKYRRRHFAHFQTLSPSQESKLHDLLIKAKNSEKDRVAAFSKMGLYEEAIVELNRGKFKN